MVKPKKNCNKKMEKKRISFSIKTNESSIGKNNVETNGIANGSSGPYSTLYCLDLKRILRE